MERCPSGLRSTLGKRVYVNRVPRVRIPLSPFNILLSVSFIFDVSKNNHEVELMRNVFLIFFFWSINIFASPQQKASVPQVLVSIAPYQYLVEAVAGDTCRVQTVVCGNKDPHTYEISPKHFKMLKQTSLWFRTNESFEKCCEKSLSCKQVDLNDGIHMISSGSSCLSTQDLHTWLSPKNLQQQTQTIIKALSDAFPEHASLYAANGASLIHSLQQLDQEVLQLTSTSEQRHVLVAHGAFGYFCRDYSFVQHTIEKSNDGELSPKDLLRIAQYIRDYDIKTIILLKHDGKRSSTLLAKRFNMHTVALDPYAFNVLDNIKTIANTFANL